MFWPKLQKIVIVIFLVMIVVSIVVYQVWGDSFDLGQMRQYLKDFGIWTPIIFTVFFTFIIIFLPSTSFMAIAGILFGIKYGFIYTMIGSMISSVIVFWISRKLGKEYVDKVLEHKYLKLLSKYNKRLESGGIWDLLFLRVVPIMPFNVLNIIMGVSKIKTKNYLVGTVLGLLPSNIAAVYLGDIIMKVF